MFSCDFTHCVYLNLIFLEFYTIRHVAFLPDGNLTTMERVAPQLPSRYTAWVETMKQQSRGTGLTLFSSKMAFAH